MNSNLDNDQLFNICAGLFKGFIEWIDVNSQNEKALILDSAYHFKNQILNQELPTLQKKYFQTPQDLSSQETHKLLNQWKDTFSNLINSDLDREIIGLRGSKRMGPDGGSQALAISISTHLSQGL